MTRSYVYSLSLLALLSACETLPDMQMPDMRMPDMQMPDMKMPDFSFNDSQTDDIVTKAQELRKKGESETALALLRTVAYAWKQDALAANAQAVLSLGKELHGRLATMGGHLSRLGHALENAATAYNQTVGSLETRVLARWRPSTGAGSRVWMRRQNTSATRWSLDAK